MAPDRKHVVLTEALERLLPFEICLIEGRGEQGGHSYIFTWFWHRSYCCFTVRGIQSNYVYIYWPSYHGNRVPGNQLIRQSPVVTRLLVFGTLASSRERGCIYTGGNSSGDCQVSTLTYPQRKLQLTLAKVVTPRRVAILGVVTVLKSKFGGLWLTRRQRPWPTWNKYLFCIL